jgi:hypothetical protein
MRHQESAENAGDKTDESQIGKEAQCRVKNPVAALGLRASKRHFLTSKKGFRKVLTNPFFGAVKDKFTMQLAEEKKCPWHASLEIEGGNQSRLVYRLLGLI